ncbi:MAG: TonB-dependent receptor [Flavobacteriales bacterium]|nr:TonB-dependent receptor [Flavobacteriales bacterium]
MRKAFWFLFLFSGIQLGFAQTGTISGTLYDDVIGEPLIGAAVLIGPGVGTVTDFDGKFKIEADYGDYTLTVSYVGFEPVSVPITLDRKLLVLYKIKLKTTQLSEVQVVADVARERETPVAFTNILPARIEEELASQDLPMILNSTPGVYATNQGGGDGDTRVTIRGFSQRNIAVMIDGVPVNDMENGWVFWSNWFGLDGITRSIQVQRGLGASKIAIPSVGGTMNILTKGIDQKAGGSIKQEIGNDGFMRSSISLSSGKLKNGWGYSGTVSYKQGNGWVDQNFTQGVFYYGKVEKKFEKHILSLSGYGAPQKHGQRSFKRSIGIYDAKTATKLGVNIDNIPEYGLRYNQHWGELERYELDAAGSKTNITTEQFNTKQNYFHKPQITLRDFWTVNDRLYISNIAYLSVGNGGGTRLNSTLSLSTDPSGFDSITGQANLQGIYDHNTGYAFVPLPWLNEDPTIDPSISATEHGANNYIKSSINNHVWYGFLSTATFKMNDMITYSGGVDFRSYKGEHYREVYDLMGADYAVDTDNANNPNTIKRVGDKIDYHNDGFVRWGGVFGQMEYKTGLWSGFVNISGAVSSYKRIDYFLPKVVSGTNTPIFYTFNKHEAIITPVVVNSISYTPESEGLEYQESEWKTIPGFTFKTGANYNLTERMNVFLNLGYLSRTPRFSNVFDFGNKFFVEIENELIQAIELGYSYRYKKFATNLNAYYTNWNNRPVTLKETLEFPDGPRTININGMDAIHKGAELDFAYKINQKLKVEGVVSIGDWTWNSA